MAKQNTEVATINNTTALASKELTTCVQNIRKAQELGKNSAWVIANQYNEIVENELFDEDFDQLKDFACYMGVTPSLITQYIKAVKFVETTTYNCFNVNTLSVVRAYLLSSLKDNLNEFINWCESNDRDITEMSDAGLKAVIKEWKKEQQAVDIEATEETVTEETPVETDENVSRETVDFEIDGIQYSIPVDVLEQYRLI